MPTATQPALQPASLRRPLRRSNPLVRGITLWHLLSLDAPTVAMLWTWFLARTNRVSLPAGAILAMGVAVWMLYAADRLLDTRALTASAAGPEHGQLEPRHYFHRLHQGVFRFTIFIASLVLASLLPGLAPQSIHLYLALGTLLFGYFVVIHGVPIAAQSNTGRLPKELAVGVFFSAAIFIPTIARSPGLRPALLPGAILFAAVCSLNCLFIYAWEHPAEVAPDASPKTHFATRFALRILPALTVAIAFASIILLLTCRSLPWSVPCACGLSSVLLLLTHSQRAQMAATTLRAVADLCLLTPVLLLHL